MDESYKFFSLIHFEYPMLTDIHALDQKKQEISLYKKNRLSQNICLKNKQMINKYSDSIKLKDTY